MTAREPPGRSAKAIEAFLAGRPYRPVRFLGRGGMGEVWVVEHTTLGRRFAFKIQHAHVVQFADRARVEAEIMGRIRHPHVVEIVDFWTSADQRPCIVMELLQGRSLWDELLEHPRLPMQEAVQWTCQALSGLAAAHSLGVVHRDIKPENLFLHEARGLGRVLKILDFGTARVLPTNVHAPVQPSTRTASGAMVGSPRFMSPEGARGERVDVRADIFSIGLVLYTMLVGETPFDRGSHKVDPPSRHTETEIPSDLDVAVLRALREDPAERYQTADEFIAALLPLSARRA
ncbi:MAG: serine/threonine-protein kinase [Myxococcota bacterium]